MSRHDQTGKKSLRRFRVEAVPLRQTDLHKLTQMFLGMAVSRSESSMSEQPVEDERQDIE